MAEYNRKNVIGSYRKYYIEKKQSFASWKSPAKPPKWWTEGVANGIQVGR